jgi:hypothetical protein
LYETYLKYNVLLSPKNIYRSCLETKYTTKKLTNKNKNTDKIF